MVYLVSFCLDLRIYDIDLSTVHFIIIIFNLIKHTYIKLNAKRPTSHFLKRLSMVSLATL